MNRKLTEKKFTNWWNDGENKFSKFIYIFVSWWDNGKNKFLKAIYFSIFLHFLWEKIHRKITKLGSGLVLNHEHTNQRRGQDQKLPPFPRLIFNFADGSSPGNHFRPINQGLALI
mgnify:CR=1 FL=1